MLRLAADAGLLLMDVLAALPPACAALFFLFDFHGGAAAAAVLWWMLFVFEEVKNHDVRFKDPRVLSVLSTIFVCLHFMSIYIFGMNKRSTILFGFNKNLAFGTYSFENNIFLFDFCY